MGGTTATKLSSVGGTGAVDVESSNVGASGLTTSGGVVGEAAEGDGEISSAALEIGVGLSGGGLGDGTGEKCGGAGTIAAGTL